MSDLAPGQVFAGYTVERMLGRGGMGSVYLARHPRLPRLVALKLLNTELSGADEVRARFEREAEVVAQLDHPNIIDIYDRGFDEGQLWISMQYVEGTDAVAAAGPGQDASRALRIAGETAKGLDYAHAAGVLHRDVKPANILLSGDDPATERVVLTDFGIARMPNASSLTATGSFTATLAYAAPEQLTGAPLDPRTDQYALACSLFVLLTGAGPYDAVEPGRVISGHISQPVPLVTAYRPGLPAALDSVLARALAKTPEQRFSSCQEFIAAATAAFRPGAAPIAVPPPPQPQRASQPTQYAQPAPAWTTPPQPYAPAQPYAPPRRGRSPWTIVLAFLAVMVVFCGGGGTFVAFNIDAWMRTPDQNAIYDTFPKMLSPHFWGGSWGATGCHTTTYLSEGVTAKVDCGGAGSNPSPIIGYYKYKDAAGVAAYLREWYTDPPRTLRHPGSPLPIQVYIRFDSYSVVFPNHPELALYRIGAGKQAPHDTPDKFVNNWVMKAPLFA